MSVLLTRIAQGNVDLAAALGDDRDRMAAAVDLLIEGELQIAFPSLKPVARDLLRTRMPKGLRHPAFGRAWLALRERAATAGPVMELPTDLDSAIVMACLGVSAAILRARDLKPILPPTDDVDQLIACFSRNENVVIGFEPASTRFFYLVSGSMHSVRRCLDEDPRFAEVRKLIPREKLVERPGPQGFWGVVPKEPHHRISTILHADNKGGPYTTAFIGGWMENGAARDDGFFCWQPMPARILEYIMRHGAIAFLLMRLLEE